MINEITESHKAEYGKLPSVVYSVPGNINMLGEHCQVCKGQVLAFAIDKRLYMAASLRNDNALCFYSSNLDERKKNTINSLKFRKEDRWANYAKGVMDEVIRMGFKIKGLNLTILSEIPMGMGLASSSAMTVATACVLKELFQLDMSDAQLIEASWSAEANFMGIREGIYSSIISYYAQPSNLCVIDIKTLKVKYLPFLPQSMSIIITNSQVKENMGDDEKGIIEKSCAECSQALGFKNSSLDFHRLKPEDLSDSIEGLSERARRICLHFVLENIRVKEFCDALAGHDFEELGKVLFRSHESLRDYLEISCPEIDWLVKRCMEIEGVFGTRMIGNGYGGCTVTLINSATQKKYEEYLEEYERIFGFKASMFSIKSGSGAQLHIL